MPRLMHRFREWFQRQRQHGVSLWGSLMCHLCLVLLLSRCFLPTQPSAAWEPISTEVAFVEPGDEEAALTLPLAAEETPEEPVIEDTPPETVSEVSEQPLETTTATDVSEATATGDSVSEFAERRRQNGGGEGVLTISLIWESIDDIDLKIQHSDGTQVYCDNRRTTWGELDLDANVGSSVINSQSLTTSPIENVFGDGTPGVYYVIVSLYQRRTQGPIPFALGVWVREGETREFRDVFKLHQSFMYAFELHGDRSVTWLDVQRVEPNSPGAFNRANGSEHDPLADRLLERAQDELRRNHTSSARRLLRQLIENYPHTSAAQTGNQLLRDLERRLQRRSR